MRRGDGIALIGSTGFVGRSLRRQTKFTALYNSQNIEEIRGRAFETVYCCGAPGKKWIANQNPDEDWKSIHRLISSLNLVSCSFFVLISTVDVFANPVGVDERSTVSKEGLHAYGRHRRELEEFCERKFGGDLLIARLAGLVGPGLQKNALFDLAHDNQVDRIPSNAEFQFYPMSNLWWDLEMAKQACSSLIHLTAEPVKMSDVARECFGVFGLKPSCGTPPRYDFQTVYAGEGFCKAKYQYNQKEVFTEIRSYNQSCLLQRESQEL